MTRVLCFAILPFMATEKIVSWDPAYSLAKFAGPGGFTQVKMSAVEAAGIARALGADYYMSQPGTNIR